MFKYRVIAALIWLVYLSSWVNASEVEMLIFALAIPSSVFIIGSFVGSMIPLHRQMVRYKRREIAKINASISEILAHRYASLSGNQRDALKFMEERATRIDALPEWPFRVSSLIGVTVSSLLSLTPSLLKLALEWR